MRTRQKQILAAMRGTLCVLASAATVQGYAFNMIVPDVRQPLAISGGSACPVKAHHPTTPGYLAFRWSTSLGTAPTSILTQDQTPTGRLNEIEQIIQQSLAAWTNVGGTALNPSWLAPLARVATQNACGSDGMNSICFDQPDMGFTPGVLAFTRVIGRGPNRHPGWRRARGNGVRANTRRRYLFQSQRHFRDLRHATGSRRKSKILRLGIAAHA